MFVELNNLLNISDSHPPSGKCVLIREDGVDASFVIHHLTSLYMRGGHSVCFLSLSQSFNHYNNVGKKLGVDLKIARDKGQLVFIEGLKVLGQNLLDSSSDKETDSSLEHSTHFPFRPSLTSRSEDLKYLYFLLRATYLKLKGQNKKVLLLIDDLSIFLNTGISSNNVGLFIQYLQQLVVPSQNSEGCLAALVHMDGDGEDEDGELLLRRTWHHSDLVIQAQGLPSGYSKDVHGQLNVVWRHKSQKTPTADRKQTMQYKVTDKNVNLFARGLSAAVI